jgi:hypothetical protein
VSGAWRCRVTEELTGLRERVGRSPIRALGRGRRVCSAVRPRRRVQPRRFLREVRIGLGLDTESWEPIRRSTVLTRSICAQRASCYDSRVLTFPNPELKRRKAGFIATPAKRNDV